MTMPIDLYVLEDDPNAASTLRSLIAGAEGFQLLGIFPAAAEFFAFAQKKKADVLLLDFELPDQNALSVLRRIKTIPHFDGMKVLIFTAFEDETRLILALEEGASGFLLKDTNPGLLLAEIQSVHLGGAPITARMARALLGRLSQKPDESGLLTPQEGRVLRLMAMGLTYAEAAQKLGISVNTIKNYTENIYRKLEVKSKSGAITEARARGMI